MQWSPNDVIVILREVTLNNDVDKYGSEVCGITYECRSGVYAQLNLAFKEGTEI